jgi:RNA polymerase sigma-70 factor (ECF subfamily)
MSAEGMIPLDSRAGNHSYQDSLHQGLLYQDPQVSGDEGLVAAAKIGHRAAFDELCRRHAEKVFRVVHRITRNQEDAEDAVQDSFLKAFLHLQSFDGRSQFATWLTRIAINSALMSLRKGRTKREIPMGNPHEDDDLQLVRDVPDASPNPEELLFAQERREILREAIGQLRPTLRHTVEAHTRKQGSFRDTAKLLGISVAAAKGRLFHARAALRRSRRMRSIEELPWKIRTATETAGI